MTTRELEAPFRASFRQWLRQYAVKTGRTYHAMLEMAWRCEGW